MRHTALVLAAALLGCQSTPRPTSPPPLLEALDSADDPYAVACAGEATEVGHRIPRVAGWSDAAHLHAIERFVAPADAAGPPLAERIELRRSNVRVSGTPAEVAAIERFLADRTRFASATVALEARFASLDPSRLPRLTSIHAGDGLAWAVLPRRTAERVANWGPAPDPALIRDGAAGLLRAPLGEAPFAGLALEARPALTRKAEVLVVDLEGHVVDAPRGKLVAVSVQASASSHARQVFVPSQRRGAELQGRFVLRADDALLLVQGAPAGEAQVLVLTWRLPGTEELLAHEARLAVAPR